MNVLNRLVPTFCNVLTFRLKTWDVIPVRNKIRYFFPRPRERKRVKDQGYFARLKTLEGRKILMRRILKGRHVIGH